MPTMKNYENIKGRTTMGFKHVNTLCEIMFSSHINVTRSFAQFGKRIKEAYVNFGRQD